MMHALDGLIMAVSHEPYLKMQSKELCAFLASDCVLIDVKSALNPADLPAGITYWSL